MSRARQTLDDLRAGIAPTRMDRFIARHLPGWGLGRLEARASMAVLGGQAWTGARRDLPEFKNWNPQTGSPDDEQRYDRAFLLSRATDLERNDAVAGGAVAEAVLSVVGTGLSLHPEPNRKILGWSQDQAVEWAEELKTFFNLWAGDARECDISRRRNFYQGQAVAYRTVASRGDAYTLLPRKRHPGTSWFTKFQIMEGDRLMTPTDMAETDLFSQGVEMDGDGGYVKFWFSKQHPSLLKSRPGKADFIPVEAWGADGRRLVLPLMHESRLDLRRGYPLLAPIIKTLKSLSQLTENELAASVVSSFIAVVIKKAPGSGKGPLGGSVTKDTEGKPVTEWGPATVAELNPGEEIQNVMPNRPNGAFDPFWQSLIGQLSMRIGMPPEVLLKKFSSSYTAAKGALLQWWKFVNMERENLLAPDFCQPLFEAWMDEAVSSGKVKAPGYFANPMLRAAYCNARWVGDAPPILDPAREAQFAKDLLDYGLTTHAEQTMRLTGGDFESNHERLAREVRMRKADGLITDLKPEPFANADPTAKPAAPAKPAPDGDTEDTSGGNP